ncbi:hypothetical protein Y88_1127 [Novosphingobium nitrogenifigens DSM 19370]|uniref:Uncharacterized protein n=1 Tax=Novosphingobium nitrogenifigens DSM 19370 TaxID=983920 RepID=F1Z8F9_9SPHN|nr:hypothetical protein Y88_1127 [Novosphingobium nitrogenifigens DSM 19370]
MRGGTVQLTLAELVTHSQSPFVLGPYQVTQTRPVSVCRGRP